MLENGSVNRNRSIDRRLCRVRVRLLLDTPGYRLDVSRNLWDGSGLKVDSALTVVRFCLYVLVVSSFSSSSLVRLFGGQVGLSVLG
jgi:hypothetical protein